MDTTTGLKVCPRCKARAYVLSIFGCVCSQCLFDPRKDKPTPQELTQLHLYAKKCHGYALLTIEQLELVWYLICDPTAKIKANGKYKSIFESDLEKIARGWRYTYGQTTTQDA